MTQSILRDGSRQWREELTRFVDHIRSPLPSREQLTPLQDWQRRITGGVLIQFFEFLEESADEDLFPKLADHPLEERLFLFISDRAGLVAASELMDTESEQAFCLLKEEWRAFLESADTDDDDDFVHHYQFWSVWHTEVPENWEVPPLEEGFAYWIHEEGFALADGAGRGAQHLWRWDGEKMELVDEMMTSWSS